MPFSGGGGSGQLTAHVHDNTPLQGGPLNFNNTTIGGMGAGDITYSDGAALQTLTYPAVPAGESLKAVALSTAPSWVAGGGFTMTTQTIIPTHATTYTGVATQTLTNGTATLANRAGGTAVLTYDFVGEKNTEGYIYFGWDVAGSDVQVGAIVIGTGGTGRPAGGAMTYFTSLNGDSVALTVRMNSGTTTIYSTVANGNTQGQILELS